MEQVHPKLAVAHLDRSPGGDQACCQLGSGRRRHKSQRVVWRKPLHDALPLEPAWLSVHHTPGA